MSVLDKPLRFILLAGEASGDNLGASLIQGLKARYPDARFEGIGGENMIQAGFESWVDIERLSVNGFIEPLKRLPELLRILLSSRDRILAADPVCFIGIDFNFFNLLLAGMLKKRGVKTVHYVSPTVWAWRKGRIKGIKKKVDLMLTLYPFELDIYKKNDINAVFVGHPKADEISPEQDPDVMVAARNHFDLPQDKTVVAILPGSRGSEVALTGPDFLQAAKQVSRAISGIEFIIPAANKNRAAQLKVLIRELSPELKIHLVLGEAKRVMQAADVVMVNSGTATLEAMLLKKPMLMSYRLGWFTYAIVSRLVDTRFFALPNILSQKQLVPEFIQETATPENLSRALLKLLRSDEQTSLLETFDTIHRQLRKNAGFSAAEAVSNLVE